MQEKATLGNPLLVNYVCYLLLNLWGYSASMSCFYTGNFPTILGNLVILGI